MKKIILTALLTLLALGIASVVYFTMSSELSMENETSKAVVVSTFSAFGGMNKTTVNTDKVFTKNNNLPMNSEKSCIEGRISDDEYATFISYIESTNFLEKKIHQRDESGLICEGKNSLTVSINGKTNEISFPCVGKFTPQTQEISDLVTEINTALEDLLDKSNQNSCIDK